MARVKGPVYLAGPAAYASTPGLPSAVDGFPALLCDRDGTIMENRQDYVREPAHIQLFSRAVRTLRKVSESGVPIILVTNQSLVGRGILTVEQVISLHRQVVDLLSAAGVRITGTYMCLHAPADACGCRKPAPGMIREALTRFRLDPERTVFVGDSVDDMLAARRAGVFGVMVCTGRGAVQAARLTANAEIAHTPVVPDLSAAGELFGRLFEGTSGGLVVERDAYT